LDENAGDRPQGTRSPAGPTPRRWAPAADTIDAISELVDTPRTSGRGPLRRCDAPTIAEWRSPWLIVATAIGAVVLAVTWVGASNGVWDLEVDVFRWFNSDLPDGLEPILWLPMQFGALGAVAAAAVAQLGFTRQWLPALVTSAVGIENWAFAKVVKPIVGRGRPGVEIGDVVHRGGSIGGGVDASEGFVSGHAAVASGLAVALTLALPRRWRWVPWLLVVLVAVGRMYFGAHLPLDIVGGSGLGVLIAGVSFAVAARVVPARPAAAMDT
jgi:undecaprenyl-diphosphatase